MMDPVLISQKLLNGAYPGGEALQDLLDSLAHCRQEELQEKLNNNNSKKAFWINIYNAFVRWLLSNHPEYYKHKWSFFSKKYILIAGYTLSLNDIEHGILRSSRPYFFWKWLSSFSNHSFEKKFRVIPPDFRIHFALNCGAKSCPPVAYYDPNEMDWQLDLATTHYLKSEVEYAEDQNILYLPKLMSWYRADFGYKKGILKLLSQFHIVSLRRIPRIRFKGYDWSLVY